MSWSLINVIIVVIINEILQALYRDFMRWNLYNQARRKARELKKPLLVIGDPHNGAWSSVFGPAYSAGNILFDLKPCTLCKNQAIEGPLHETLPLVESNSVVVYCSCVLEFIDDLDPIIKHLYRITQSRSDIFIVPIGWWSIAGWLYTHPTHSIKHVIKSAPPYSHEIIYW